MDVIVTDHHEPPEILPQALAVINPKKPGCPYPYKHLAGVGVAFKLAHALLERLPEELLEFAALGTVADLNAAYRRESLNREAGTCSNAGFHLRRISFTYWCFGY